VWPTAVWKVGGGRTKVRGRRVVVGGGDGDPAMAVYAAYECS